MQFLVGIKLIKIDKSNPMDRDLFIAAQKVIAVVLTIPMGLTLIFGGNYGQNLGNKAIIFILIQLFVVGILVILMDEMIQKGWGIGAGTSLFLALSAATLLFRELFSLSLNPSDQYEIGVITAFVKLTIDSGPVKAFEKLLFRPTLPTNSILALIGTLIVFIVIVYFELMRIEIPVSFVTHRTAKSSFPIKFLFNSYSPLISVFNCFAALYFIAIMLWTVFNQDTTNFLIRAFGSFHVNPDSGFLEPVNGLVYFLIPPVGLFGEGGVLSADVNIMSSIFRVIVYAGIVIILMMGFSLFLMYSEEGKNPEDVAEQLSKAGVAIPGVGRTKTKIKGQLERYIPPVASLSGLFIGLLVVFGDITGAKGTAILLMVLVPTFRDYIDLIRRERAMEKLPTLLDILG